jgi:hypothetical protein
MISDESYGNSFNVALIYVLCASVLPNLPIERIPELS